jgi:imidazolonepropionase-like amidohydrolase
MFKTKLPRAAAIKARYENVNATRVANMKLARRCGVPIAMGTDAGTPAPRRQYAEVRSWWTSGFRRGNHATTMGADMTGWRAIWDR